MSQILAAQRLVRNWVW